MIQGNEPYFGGPKRPLTRADIRAVQDTGLIAGDEVRRRFGVSDDETFYRYWESLNPTERFGVRNLYYDEGQRRWFFRCPEPLPLIGGEFHIMGIFINHDMSKHLLITGRGQVFKVPYNLRFDAFADVKGRLDDMNFSVGQAVTLHFFGPW